ncbi:MAG: PDZ domain-containing protein [Oscillochloris sp.]|nr:PDZ domain-containing protein [Oscillochloris sp.]
MARLRLGWIWIVAAPAIGLLAGWLYLPIVAPSLAPAPRWLLAIGLTVLAGLSVAVHGLAHLFTARQLGTPLPDRLVLGLCADSAHHWPAAPDGRAEGAVALAGPGISWILAGLLVLLSRFVLDPTLDAVVIFAALCNALLAAINLAPGYPFDGGRLIRTALQGLVRRPAHFSRIVGIVLAAGLLVWGGAIGFTQARFWGEMSLALAGLAALTGLPLLRMSPQLPDPTIPDPERLPLARKSARIAATLLLAGVLLAIPAAFLPLPYGLYAPGDAVPVGPMVTVAGLEPQPSSGALLLTTVIGQTPIVLGQWLLGQVDPAITLAPPERLVPPETTPQEQMIANVRMLEESRLVAIIVALHLAGYDAALTGSGVQVVQVIAESPAQKLLAAGDRIIAIGETPLQTADDLFVALSPFAGQDRAPMTVVRAGQTLLLEVPLLPPLAPGGLPRIGIAIATADLAVAGDIPVQIRPQGVLGGPSAGLMFTLAVYDRLTPGDLTRGRLIAGTGTIGLDGRVGPIGGVEQKVAAAERAGATVFLVPPENAAAAGRVARRITVIEVATAEEAIAALRGFAATPALP